MTSDSTAENLPSVGAPGASQKPWHVLVVDDDEIVHGSTDIALSHFGIEGRSLHLLHAYSAGEALSIVEKNPELAVALVDVVMETPDAGLRLVRKIRELPGRTALRLILRTGQPGYAPELETIQHFDINDYWSKLDQTRTKLLVGLTTAIRSYRQFVAIETQRDALEQLNRQLEEAIRAERGAVMAREDAEAALARLRDSVESEISTRTGELLESVRMLESFNQMVAHDLRGPLSGLSGMMDLIKRKIDMGDLAQVPRWIDAVSSQTLRLSALVGGLLELSQLARASLNWQPTALGELAREAVDTVLQGHAVSHATAVEFDILELPTLPVDSLMLRQVFVNLLGNAAKFSRGGPAPRVRVSAETADQRVVVSIADNGVGFDTELATKLFRPFERLHGNAFEGTGIGLTIVKRIVEMHHGQVWAESSPGQGATFRFSLPITSASAA
ncbi:hybrid sensor histidine kinase/response regulator [soil metagenome]